MWWNSQLLKLLESKFRQRIYRAASLIMATTLYHSQTELDLGPGVKCAEVWQSGCPRGWRGRVGSPGGSWGTSIGFQMVKIQGVRQGCPKGPRCISRGSQGVRHDFCPTFYTPWFSGVICVICNIFDSQLNNVNAYTSAGGQGGGFISPGLVSDFLQKCTWNEKVWT